MASLDKLLARNLGCSRAKARKLIERNGSPPLEIPDGALPAPFDLDGRSVQLYDQFHLMLNKPLGCVTALHDRTHATAVSYLRDAPLLGELRPVGRLDLDTTGLLLWTTDGEIVHRLTHPKSAVRRTYHAALARPFHRPPPDFALRDGHRPSIVALEPADEGAMHPSLACSPEATAFASLTLADGAYHEVRRIFAALGSHVVSLCRVAFGAVELPRELSPGTWLPVAAESLLPKSRE